MLTKIWLKRSKKYSILEKIYINYFHISVCWYLYMYIYSKLSWDSTQPSSEACPNNWLPKTIIKKFKRLCNCVWPEERKNNNFVVPRSELFIIFGWVTLILETRKSIVDKYWSDSRPPWLELVLVCLDVVGLRWVSWAVRYLDKPPRRAVPGWHNISVVFAFTPQHLNDKTGMLFSVFFCFSSISN